MIELLWRCKRPGCGRRYGQSVNPPFYRGRRSACSVRSNCLGDVILKTLDLMCELRDADAYVVSGFHSPMERECLNILLRGT